MGWWVGGGIDFLSTQSWLERPGSEKSLQIFFFLPSVFSNCRVQCAGKAVSLNTFPHTPCSAGAYCTGYALFSVFSNSKT
jgi:hypothetical protein